LPETVDQAANPEKHKRKINWRGFSLQLFLITVLPLTVLLLAVAFGSQMLHHDAMRSLVGDRDLRAVRAAAGNLESELTHRASTIEVEARSLSGKSDLSNLILRPAEVASEFDGGLAIFTVDGALIDVTQPGMSAQILSSQLPGYLAAVQQGQGQPVFSPPFALPDDSRSWVAVGALAAPDHILVGAFSPASLIQNAISSLVSAGQTTVLVIAPGQTGENYQVLYRGGPLKTDESAPSHPGIHEALAGESGINYYQSSAGEHVVAFSPVVPLGWGMVIEEAWEDIASPFLSTTQSAPLVIVPVFLLALIALWFGASRIVRPLQELEKQAAGLAGGNFDAIHPAVGGIEEIRNLQSELVEMAMRLKAAQHSLHNYIGAITSGVENERRSLARELHDDTIQSLIALNQRIQLARMKSPESQTAALAEFQELVQQNMTNLRRMIRGLRPIYLEDIGLASSLEMLAREVGQSADLEVNFLAQGSERRLDPQVELSLYRMTQESLNNVVHHAGATQAWVQLSFKDEGLTVLIRDNGQGFNVPESPAEFAEKGHFGLLGLQERAEIIGAELSIASRPGQGTTISIRLFNSTLAKIQ
jgi:signal transduction histidine kinase